MSERYEDFLNLRRVLVAPPQSDDEIRILALELYDDGFIIRHALPGGKGEMPVTAKEAGLNPMGLMSLTLRDDLGTQYERVGMMTGGHHGFAMYRPAIPAGAKRLEVLTKGGFVPFELEPAE
jgi:hypothetical protein